MTTRTTRVAAAVAAQVLLLGVAVWNPLSARFTGEEVLLRVGVADSFEPFADAYVPLTYPDLPSQEPLPEREGDGDSLERIEAEQGAAYVPLTDEGQVWVGGDVQRTPPTTGLFLACDDSDWRLRCGIETAYVPSSEPDELRAALLGDDAVATVRVDGSGHAALIGLATAP
jgi:hypothetical protein